MMTSDFKREVQLLKTLRHPHVVLFMGWFLSSSEQLTPTATAATPSLCLVTELCWTSMYHLLHESQVRLPRACTCTRLHARPVDPHP